MTQKQIDMLEKLYDNCRAHAADTMDFWEKTTDAFYRLTEKVGEQAFTELAVDKYMELQKEICG